MTATLTPTLGDLFAAYMEYAAPRLKTCDRIRRIFNCYLSHLADKDALSLTRLDVMAERQRLADAISNKTANEVVGLIRTIFNRAVESGLIPNHNPARLIAGLPVNERNRMLGCDELPKFFRALASLRNELLRDYFLTCLFTGEQKTKVLEMRWDDIDIERGVWFIPQRKRQPRTHYLSPEVTDILARRSSTATSQWVFPSNSTSGHLEGPDKSWQTLIGRSGIKDLRLNDLRNCRQNIDQIRAAMSQHFYVSLRVEAKKEAKEVSRAEQDRKQAVYRSLAAPVERPPIPRALELSPVNRSSAPTFRQLFDYYMQHHGNNCRSAGQMRGNFQRYLSGIADRPADQIQPSDVIQLLTYIGENLGRAAANRALEILKAVFNKAIKWQLIDMRNPCLAADPYKIESRDRFLSAEEIKALKRAMQRRSYSRNYNAFIMTCLYTGQRESNVLAMRWQDIDHQSQTWRIPMTKSGKPHVVPLIDEALQEIESQRGRHPIWVFPGRGKSGHMVSPGNAWRRLLKEAGLNDVRIHDLRRTMGSWQAKTGVSLPIIGKTLGHSNPRATSIYARLDVEPVRAAMQKAVSAMHGSAQTVEKTPPVTLDQEQLAALIAQQVAGHLKQTR